MSEEKNKASKPIKSVMEQIFNAMQIADKMKEFEILDGWEEMMGKAVASRTEKLYIRNKVLHIELNSSVMRDELAHGKQVIIERVNQFAGARIIEDVWFT
jgi:hypothetical protein